MHEDKHNSQANCLNFGFLCNIRWRKVVVNELLPCCRMECVHSRDQRPYWSFETKGRFCIKIEFNSQKIGLLLQHGRCSFVLLLQHGYRDVMWTHSILDFLFSKLSCFQVLGPLAGSTLFTEDDFKLLENFDMDLYARKVRDQVCFRNKLLHEGMVAR